MDKRLILAQEIICSLIDKDKDLSEMDYIIKECQKILHYFKTQDEKICDYYLNNPNHIHFKQKFNKKGKAYHALRNRFYG